VQALQHLGPIRHPSLLAGSAGYEDAGVFRLDSERALVQTLDFFPPIVDDPRWFGRIAAANALSDVYAMGGAALTAMNIVAWPKKLGMDVLGEVLIGGREKIEEAGAALCGGHSVTDQEVKYGLSVTGLVHPERFWRNSGAREGDLLILTKPLGMGAVSTAIKKGKASEGLTKRAMDQMATLNKAACEAVLDQPVHGATDVTGFGLMGHGCEMAEGSGVTLHLRASHVPIFDGALALARAGTLSGGVRTGRANLQGKVQTSEGIEQALADLLFDAETSGGLLLAVPDEAAEKVRQRLADAGVHTHAVVGEFRSRGPAWVVVE
jgi:selenide,water dikinase